ncbi:alpha/beta fold hydrolase [Agathobacter sp.]
MREKIYQNEDIKLKYYEIENQRQPLVFIHAQGVDGLSYAKVARKLSQKFHVISIDCYGHGGSLHNAEKYNIKSIGDAISTFIQSEIGQKVWLLGHSSGGLIASYIAAETDLCEKLILEDPPLFSCQGERRKSSFNYVDLSTICHNYLEQDEENDFVLYYFKNQYAWNFFPEQSREKVKGKLTKMALAYRKKHPSNDLRVLFWPKAALAGFQGMNHYDPRFGETFYNDSFHQGILHEDLLKKIKCPTVFMKAKTNISDDGILMAALSDDDVNRVTELIDNCTIVHFDCGHGIHIEKSKEFISCIMGL